MTAASQDQHQPRTAIAASPTKLQDGTWGARTSADVKVGDTLTVTARSGKSWEAVVTQVVWTGKDRYGSDQIAIVATESSERSQAMPRRFRGRKALLMSGCCGYPCPVSGRKCTGKDPCHDCM